MRRTKICSKKAVVKGNQLVIPFSHKTINQVKTLFGRKYNQKHRYWVCPINSENLVLLRSWGFNIIGLSSKQIKKMLSVSVTDRKESIKPAKVPNLKLKMRRFQKIGTSFIDIHKGRGLIADEMGLGKTIQSLGYVQLYPKKRPVLICCPAIAKLVWKREIRKWFTKMPRVQILEGETPYKIKGDIIIISYSVVAFWLKSLLKLQPKIMITDECHYYKSDKAKRTKVIKLVAESVPNFIAISGTPIENRPIEIFNAANIINPKKFPDRWHFAKQFCDLKRGRFGWDFSGSSNEHKLHKKLTSTIMIRRLKKDVVKELPTKIRTTIPFEITNRKEYESALSDFKTFIKNKTEKELDQIEVELQTDLQAFMKKHKIDVYDFGTHQLDREQIIEDKVEKATALTQIEVLKQLAVIGKLDGVVEWIKDFLNSGEKLVVFATHTFVVDRLMKEFKNIAVKINGSVSGKQRIKNVSEFQKNPLITLFVGNIDAAGVVITLTAASNVAVIEFPWNPGKLDQAEDRCHRIGQKYCVNVYNLVAVDTMEEEIIDIIERKRLLISKAIDGIVDKSESTDSVFMELVNLYK